MFVYYTTTNRVFSEGAFPFSLKKKQERRRKNVGKSNKTPPCMKHGGVLPCEMELKKFGMAPKIRYFLAQATIGGVGPYPMKKCTCKRCNSLATKL